MICKTRVLLVIGICCAQLCAMAAVIVGVSIPPNSNDQHSFPRNDNVFSVSSPPFPLNTSSGIGHIINPASLSLPSEFSLHDHVYVGPNVPDPSRAVVTYEFSSPAIVDQLHVLQHLNGITQVEGFVGNSLASLTSIGSVFGQYGDVTLDTGFGGFVEGESDTFDFNNTQAGLFFQFIIRKTSNSGGYSNYRAIPADATGSEFLPAPVPEPSETVLAAASLLGMFLALRRALGARHDAHAGESPAVGLQPHKPPTWLVT